MATLLPNLESKIFIFMTMLSFKQVESNFVRKSPANKVVVGLLIFLIVWILDKVNCIIIFSIQKIAENVVHAACLKKKICEVNNFWYFLRRVNFILMFFKEDLDSLLSAGKPFFSNLEDWKVKILALAN